MAQPGEQIEGLRVKPICRGKPKRDDRQRREWLAEAAGHDGRPEDIAGAIPGIEERAALAGEQIRSDVRRVTHEEREAGPGEASRLDHKRQAHADDEGDERMGARPVTDRGVERIRHEEEESAQGRLRCVDIRRQAADQGRDKGCRRHVDQARRNHRRGGRQANENVRAAHHAARPTCRTIASAAAATFCAMTEERSARPPDPARCPAQC
jgi:hypothetical protein